MTTIDPTKGEGEYGVKFNEPTTGEIVRALRFCYESEGIECYECPCRVSGGAYLCHMDKLADRLESQERDIETLRAFHERYAEQTSKKYVEDICALTARAEQAEAREKAMIDYLRGYCQFCEHDDCMEEERPCCDCENVTHDGRECKWELRGLPQDGEGV